MRLECGTCGERLYGDAEFEVLGLLRAHFLHHRHVADRRVEHRAEAPLEHALRTIAEVRSYAETLTAIDNQPFEHRYIGRRLLAILEAMDVSDLSGRVCECDGCWGCKGHVPGCTCDIDWDEVYSHDD